MLKMEYFNLDITTVTVTVLVLILGYIYFVKNENSRYNLPPGPRRLPIIGTLYINVLSLEWGRTIRKKYGDLTLTYLGPTRFVFINSHKLMKCEAGTFGHWCADRGVHMSFTTRVLNPNRMGFVNSDYHERFRKNRTSSLTILKNLGVGRSQMEEKIHEEAKILTGSLLEKDGQSFDPKHLLTCSVANVILSVIINKRHNHDDAEFLEVIQQIDDSITSGKFMTLIDAMPLLRFINPFKEAFNKLIGSNKGMRDYMWKYVKEHVQCFHPGLDTDYVMCWLDKHYSSEQKNVCFDEEDFSFMLRDFLVAGIETTTTSLKWTLIHLANKPEVQEKLYNAIESTVGRERPVLLRDHVPYLEAVVQEVQRFNTVAPYALPHYTKSDNKIGDYDIPANTYLMYNLYAVHMDEEIFNDPLVFRPERFLDEEGKFIKHPQVIPFGIGKRSCLGELLARQELYIFTAALAQNFKFLPPEGERKIDDEAVLGFTNAPKPFHIRAIPR